MNMTKNTATIQNYQPQQRLLVVSEVHNNKDTCNEMRYFSLFDVHSTDRTGV